MNKTMRLAGALTAAKIRADYYQTGEGALLAEAASTIYEQQAEVIDLRNRWEEACDRIAFLEAPDKSCPHCTMIGGHWDTCPDRKHLCGAKAATGPCIMPLGHNRGRLDIPSNHSAQQWEVFRTSQGKWASIETTENRDGESMTFSTWREAYSYAYSGGRRNHECDPVC